jgi:hypothetical protein
LIMATSCSKDINSTNGTQGTYGISVSTRVILQRYPASVIMSL